MNSEKKDNEIENHGKKIIFLALALILLIGGTYAWLTLTLNGNKQVRLEAGTLSLRLANESNAIEINDAYPMTDAEGLATTPYTFTVENDGTIASDYTVFLVNEAIDASYNPMKLYRIKYSLTKTVKTKKGDTIDAVNDEAKSTDTVTELLNPLNGSAATAGSSETEKNPLMEIDKGTLEANDYILYSLNLWVDSSATLEEMENAAFAARLSISASQQGIEDE